MHVGHGFKRELRRSLVLVGLGIVGWTVPVAAQLGTWQPKPAGDLANTEWFKLVASGNVISTFSNPSVYVGPYTAALANDPTHGTFSVYCVDFLHSITTGQVWNAAVSNVSAGGLANTRLGLSGVSDALMRYQKAIWLATQFVSHQTRTQWTGIHDAIWASITPTYHVQTLLGWYWLNQVNGIFALGTPTDVDWSQWRVITDVSVAAGSGGAQEFVVAVPPSTVTPEPETYVMMLTGLLALMALMYRRRQQLEL